MKKNKDGFPDSNRDKKPTPGSVYQKVQWIPRLKIERLIDTWQSIDSVDRI